MCKYYAEFEGICCNGDCEYRVDNPPEGYCEECEFKEEE